MHAGCVTSAEEYRAKNMVRRFTEFEVTDCRCRRSSEVSTALFNTVIRGFASAVSHANGGYHCLRITALTLRNALGGADFVGGGARLC